VWVAEQRGAVVAMDSLELAIERPLFEVFAALAREPFAVLLDSAASPGAYSMLAFGPSAVLTAWSSPRTAANGSADLELRSWGDARFGAPSELLRWEGRPFTELARLLDEWAVPDALRARVPGPFAGGAIGVAGYDAGRFCERLPELAQRDLVLPELCFLFVDAVFVLEHASGCLRLIVTARGPDEVAAQTACAQLRATFLARFQDACAACIEHGDCRVGGVQAYADEAAYCETVRAAHEHILAGDVFEVCTSHRLNATFSGDTWQLYAALRAASPAAFACFLVMPWASLLSSSPERFLSLTRERVAESRPIKGTRPRGADPQADALLRAELLGSEKDRAENVMIVDLVRNDFGRVCEVDSIHVPELMIVEDHPRVFHMVSTVRGRLAPEHSAVDLFTACFPPGSMTGAPKIEAMRIIDALEPYRRGIYSGAVGYFDAGGAMDFSVVIRSFVLTGGSCYFSVGGAVVADSEAAAEYRETMDKARALLEALSQLRAAAS
jgi:para-aminobenzoate synthetase component 1